MTQSKDNGSKSASGSGKKDQSSKAKSMSKHESNGNFKGGSKS